MTDTIRIILVDDHDMVRSGLATFLQEFDDLELVGEAADGPDGVRLCLAQKPDVVLMDLVMPGFDGATATRQILEELPDTRIIALTTFSEDDLVNGAMRAGAISYLMKNITIDELARAIRDAYAGKSSIAPEALQALIRGKDDTTQLPPIHLTTRERDVLKCLMDGATNRQIAEELDVSLSTVKQHVSNILAKLGASSRTEAVAIAMKRKITT